MGEKTRYQRPSILALPRNKRVIEIERDAEFPAGAKERHSHAKGERDPKGQRYLQVKAKENVDKIGKGLYDRCEMSGLKQDKKDLTSVAGQLRR